MKKLLLRVFLLSALGLSSCGDSDGDSDKEKGSSASNIKVSELNTECDCIEAANSLMKELVSMMDGKKLSELSKDEEGRLKEKTKPLQKKADVIKKHCNDKFPMLFPNNAENVKNCAAVEEFIQLKQNN